MTGHLVLTHAWLHFIGNNSSLIKDLIIAALLEVGVRIQARDPGSLSGPGVLYFDEITASLCDQLREWSSNGLKRVLAVGTVPSALTNDGAWRLLQAGASDVLVWDNSLDPANAIAARLGRWQVVDDLVQSPLVQDNLIGHDPAWISVLRQIVEVAHFTDASVLIMGETGTGKELVASLIHSLDSRADKRDLVILDCTTIVPELSGSEFFGHERGAFTGAIAARDGAFALADGGTLFLDEVGELPSALQAQLLRVIQEHTYKRVGSNTWRHTNFRLVCATNRDLLQGDSPTHFRRDLYYRLANWVCTLPPLRQRTADIIPLARHFMRQLQSDTEPPELDGPVCEYLLTREYPGNVRDLKQLVSRMMYRHVGPGPITIGDVPEEERLSAGSPRTDWRTAGFEQVIRHALMLGAGLKDIRSAAEDLAVRLAVDDEHGNLQRAARKLRVTDRTLQLRRASRRSQTSDQDGDGSD